MSQRKDSLYLFVLACLLSAGIMALLGIGRPIPTELWQAAVLVLGGFLGVARQDIAAGGPAATQSVNLAGSISPTVNGSAAPAAVPAAVVPTEGMGSDVIG